MSLLLGEGGSDACRGVRGGGGSVRRLGLGDSLPVFLMGWEDGTEGEAIPVTRSRDQVAVFGPRASVPATNVCHLADVD